jgi:HEPN domain-containing protein
MRLDAIRVRDTRDWLTKANEDLDAANLLIKQKRPRTGVAAFHTQQAAEKFLKAFLTWHDRRFKKIHDLKELARACELIDNALGSEAHQLATISPWAIETRYPGDWSPPTRKEVSKAIQKVTQLYKQILSRLPKETHPS